MELRVLGPLEAIDGTTPLALGGRKPRALLARLALDANRTVAVQRLVDDLWGDAVPESASKMVQIYVSQLRKVLPEGVLHTRPPGYLVELEPEARRRSPASRSCAREGRAALAAGDPETAAARLREALALWRGPALAEFSEPFAGSRGRPPRGAAARLPRGAHRGRRRARAARGCRRRARGARRAAPAARVAAPPAHAGALPRGTPGRGARRVRALPAPARRGARDRALGGAEGAAAADPQPRPAARARSSRRAGRAHGPRRERFVGRADELERLDAALEAAERRRRHVVFVAGRAGIGKTRLTAELAAPRARRGTTVLSGRCIQLVGAGRPVPAARRRAAAAARLTGARRRTLRELPRLVPDSCRRRARRRAAPIAARALRGGAGGARRRGAGAARARGPPVGGRLHARPRRLPRASDRAAPDPARRHLSQRRGPRGRPPPPPATGLASRRRRSPLR